MRIEPINAKDSLQSGFNMRDLLVAAADEWIQVDTRFWRVLEEGVVILIIIILIHYTLRSCAFVYLV